MITVNEAEQTLLDAGFDVVRRDFLAPSVPSRYRIEHDDLMPKAHFLNEKELIAFAKGYLVGEAKGMAQC